MTFPFVSWDDRDGNTRYTTEVKAREMMMLSSRGNGSGGGRSEYNQDRGEESYDQRPQRQKQPQGQSSPQDTFSPDDDLPF